MTKALNELPVEERDKPKTLGIPPAKAGALQVLQYADISREDFDGNRVHLAAQEVSNYHRPNDDQAERHAALSRGLAQFLKTIVISCHPGPERSTAISRAREAKMWASAAIALEGL